MRMPAALCMSLDARNICRPGQGLGQDFVGPLYFILPALHSNSVRWVEKQHARTPVGSSALRMRTSTDPAKELGSRQLQTKRMTSSCMPIMHAPPCRYHTALCKQGAGCRRKICFFAHHPSELRVPEERPRIPVGAATSAARFKSAAGSPASCTSVLQGAAYGNLLGGGSSLGFALEQMGASGTRETSTAPLLPPAASSPRAPQAYSVPSLSLQVRCCAALQHQGPCLAERPMPAALMLLCVRPSWKRVYAHCDAHT